jgi:hypothetical protein
LSSTVTGVAWAAPLTALIPRQSAATVSPVTVDLEPFMCLPDFIRLRVPERIARYRHPSGMPPRDSPTRFEGLSRH